MCKRRRLECRHIGTFMTRHEILCDALRLLPGIGARDWLQIISACRQALPDATIEEAVVAWAAVEQEQEELSTNQ
jgi:hypothetical protein